MDPSQLPQTHLASKSSLGLSRNFAFHRATSKYQLHVYYDQVIKCFVHCHPDATFRDHFGLQLALSENTVYYMILIQMVMLLDLCFLLYQFKDILDKIIFGYLCQIMTPSTFQSVKTTLKLTLGPNLVMHISFFPESWTFRFREEYP